MTDDPYCEQCDRLPQHCECVTTFEPAVDPIAVTSKELVDAKEAVADFVSSYEDEIRGALQYAGDRDTREIADDLRRVMQRWRAASNAFLKAVHEQGTATARGSKR